MLQDVIVIGGGYAGMAAALQLLRARKAVLVIDAGAGRNRVASHAHGFLGGDGVPPDRIAAAARAQLAVYPNLRWVDGKARSIDGQRDAFVVTLSDGRSHRARRILFATGVSDALPEIDGIAARWGRSVFHCPYCHAYEFDGGRIGILGSGPMSVHQAELLTEWGEITFLPNGALGLEDESRRSLEARGIVIDETPIERLAGDADVVLSDGRQLSFAGLFVATRVSPASPLPAQIGCEMEETRMGTVIRTDATRQTSVPGIYACGDVASVPHSISLAVGDGAFAGTQLHRSFVWTAA